MLIAPEVTRPEVIQQYRPLTMTSLGLQEMTFLFIRVLTEEQNRKK